MNEFYENAARSWSDRASVDWSLLSNELGRYLSGVVAHFHRVHPSEKVYGIVIRQGQNWEVEVHLNTRKGLEEGVARFRKDSNGYESRTDEQLRADLGLWYYEAWKHQNFELKCPAGTDELNLLHLEVFGKLSEQESEWHQANPDMPGVSGKFSQAAAEATALLERSAELAALSKTQDFRVRFYDANVSEWDTDEMMKKARETIAGRAGD